MVPGLVGTVSLRVNEDDTALAMGSGDIPVLATPRLVALVEEAARSAIALSLEAGTTTVGTRIELDHLSPTPVGVEVIGEARLVAVDGRRLEFAVTASDGRAEVARGRHWRVVIDRVRFLERAASP